MKAAARGTSPGAAGRGSTVSDFLARQRLLVIAPHADDEVIGSGGLIAKVKDLGGEAFVLIASVGDLRHYDGTEGTVSGTTRRQELAAAMSCLGVDDYDVLYDDSDRHLRLDQVPRRELVSALERDSRVAIDRLKPTMISLPAPSYNQDHEAVHKAGMTACRPHLAALKPFQNVVLLADAPQLSWSLRRFNPTFYVDITDYLEKKIAAFRCHRSQLRPDPHNGSLESLRLLALARGRDVSVGAAEAYECPRLLV
jgi:LmbE family N-acetylglucosaminyl deacetylase